MNMSPQALLQEAAFAEDLAQQIRGLFSSRGYHWGILSLALASVLADGAHDAFPENRASGRRLVNESFAVARALLNDMHNEQPGEKTISLLEQVLITASSSVAWSGNKGAQEQMVRDLMKVLEDKPALDVAGALGTIFANMTCDNSESLAHALAGIEAFVGDCRRTARERFSLGRHAAADAQGSA